MKTLYVIAIFVVSLFIVTIAITQINPIVTGNTIEKSITTPNFFQKLFGVRETASQSVDAEVIEAADNAINAGEIQVSENCRAVQVGDSQLNGNDICSNIGKDCQWVLSEKTRTYYDSALDDPQVNCNTNDDIQVITKEYSLSAIACSGISTGTNIDICSRKTASNENSVGPRSAEPRLGEVKVSAYEPFEVMCC